MGGIELLKLLAGSTAIMDHTTEELYAWIDKPPGLLVNCRGIRLARGG